jgi:glycosyltransferase involved in cell wall biosynthesis
LREELAALASALGLDGSVHFAGYQPEPERYLRVMDVFALTSRSEGMPLAVLEAWATGIPVVATRVGGLPELIEEGRTGMLIDPDDESGLSEALDALILDRGRARQLAEAGCQQVRSRFDSRVMASSYNRHYADLLARDGIPS